MDYLQQYKKWKDYVKEETLQSELEQLEGDEQEIKNRFSSVLEFGTAGFRSVTGVGTNRINIYTVRKASQGVADYMNEKCQNQLCVAYDTRHFSKEFALETALVFAANGIKTYLFSLPSSVPELSFAIRHLGCCGGVAITASHNPKNYNGYKVYASWGGQILGNVGNAISEHIKKITDFDMVKRIDEQEAKDKGLLVEIQGDIDEKYFSYLKESVKNKKLLEKYAKDVNVVYTPLFGTGMRAFENTVAKMGFDVSVVEDQIGPDSDFPGLDTPNPEDEKAMTMAIETAKKENADIAFGTDPDADRFGAAVKTEDGKYIIISGNQIGCIITEYLLRLRQNSGELKNSDYIIRSFVSTPMVDKMAEKYGIECAVMPTGFKHFSNLVHNIYKDRHFVFGFEESCGYMAGMQVADKDGMLAAVLMLEVICECKEQGISLYDRLQKLYEEFGWYKEKVVSVLLEKNPERAKTIMEELRNNIPTSFAGQKVLSVKDYLEDESKQNMLLFEFENAWLAVRPSGTEPKIKMYYGVCEKTNSASQALLDSLDKGVEEITTTWKESC